MNFRCEPRTADGANSSSAIIFMAAVTCDATVE
jgi:hypothetical protein